MFRLGLRKTAVGEQACHKLKTKDVLKIYDMLRAGSNYQTLSRAFGVSAQQIREIARGVWWRHTWLEHGHGLPIKEQRWATEEEKIKIANLVSSGKSVKEVSELFRRSKSGIRKIVRAYGKK